MRRLIAGLSLVAIVGILAWMNSGKSKNIVLSDATISAMPDGSYMASVKMTNIGGADVLESASMEGFPQAHLMAQQNDIVVPGSGAPTLAADGVHIMMMGEQGKLEPGVLVPISLHFKDNGKVTTRAKVTPMKMDHSGSNGQEIDGTQMRLEVTSASRDGLTGRLVLNGIDLVTVNDDTAHVQGQGHAHLYLNGLKLQRLFSEEFEVGDLLPGEYSVSVTINTNDHRPYLQGNIALSDQVSVTVD